MDHDGDADIYLSTRIPGKEGSRQFLLKSEMGSFTDVANDAGLTHTGRENHASLTDFDNDGYLDLYVTGESGGILYKSVSEGKYEDVSKKAGIGGILKGNKSLFFDMDHEGDLDIFTATSGSNSLLRNNGDGTFQDNSHVTGLDSPIGNSRDVCFGDFDEDGDIDLFVLNQKNSSGLCPGVK